MINIIAFLGPSAVGKTTLREMLNLERIVTYTSRAMRDNEQDGIDYHFTTREHILSMYNNNLLLEYSEYNGNLYATALSSFNYAIETNQCVSIIVDKNGAEILKSKYNDRIMIIGVFAPFQECEERMLKRDDQNTNARLNSYNDELIALNELSDILVNNAKENWHKSSQLMNLLKAGVGEINLIEIKNLSKHFI